MLRPVQHLVSGICLSSRHLLDDRPIPRRSRPWQVHARLLPVTVTRTRPRRAFRLLTQRQEVQGRSVRRRWARVMFAGPLDVQHSFALHGVPRSDLRRPSGIGGAPVARCWRRYGECGSRYQRSNSNHEMPPSRVRRFLCYYLIAVYTVLTRWKYTAHRPRRIFNAFINVSGVVTLPRID
jgi:hypothetical protein